MTPDLQQSRFVYRGGVLVFRDGGGGWGVGGRSLCRPKCARGGESGEQETSEKGGGKENRKSSSSEMSLYGLLQTWRVREGVFWSHNFAEFVY